MMKFAHPPFDEWLTTDQPLSAYQAQALQEHLKTCEQCQKLSASWEQVHRLLATTPQAAPAAGFTARWQMRAATEKLKKQRHHTWLLLSFTASAALGLLIFFGLKIGNLFQSPAQALILQTYGIALWAYLIESIQILMRSGSRLVFGLPAAALALFVGITSILGVLWLVAFRQLTAQDRRVE
jgi:anti-sigma factor RsiW